MPAGVEIVKQVNVVTKVVDCHNSKKCVDRKGEYLGNYAVDVPNPKEGDMIIFSKDKWRTIHKTKVLDGGNF